MSHKKPAWDNQELRLLDEGVRDIQAMEPTPAESAAAQQDLLTRLEQSQTLESTIMALLRKAKERKRVGIAFAGALAVIAVVFVVIPESTTPAQAFSEVVKKLHQVTVLTLRTDWTVNPGGPPVPLKMAYRKPALMRLEMEYNKVPLNQVIDTNKHEALVLMPETSSALRLDLTAPSAERQRIELLKLVTKTLGEITDKADSVETTHTADGKDLTGFRVGNTVSWIDPKAGKLVMVERRDGKFSMILRDFEFDPPDMDESKFSLEVPAGYKLVTLTPPHIDAAGAGERDLIQYLRLSSQMIQGNRFPSTLNPMEILSLKKEGKLIAHGPMSEAEQTAFVQQFSQASAAMVRFTMSMRSENDWHYDVREVSFGQAGKPIAWWKPNGATQYRIVWADLSVTDGPAPQQ